MMKRDQQLGIRLSGNIKAALAKAATKDARTTSRLVEKIITSWLRKNGYLKDQGHDA